MSIFDKMLRVAGRGPDGTAKAIQTDASGNMLTSIIGSLANDSVKYLNNPVPNGNVTVGCYGATGTNTDSAPFIPLNIETSTRIAVYLKNNCNKAISYLFDFFDSNSSPVTDSTRIYTSVTYTLAVGASIVVQSATEPLLGSPSKGLCVRIYAIEPTGTFDLIIQKGVK